jgi:hypothetical protein
MWGNTRPRASEACALGLLVEQRIVAMEVSTDGVFGKTMQ